MSLSTDVFLIGRSSEQAGLDVIDVRVSKRIRQAADFNLGIDNLNNKKY